MSAMNLFSARPRMYANHRGAYGPGIISNCHLHIRFLRLDIFSEIAAFHYLWSVLQDILRYLLMSVSMNVVCECSWVNVESSCVCVCVSNANKKRVCVVACVSMSASVCVCMSLSLSSSHPTYIHTHTYIHTYIHTRFFNFLKNGFKFLRDSKCRTVTSLPDMVRFIIVAREPRVSSHSFRMRCSCGYSVSAQLLLYVCIFF